MNAHAQTSVAAHYEDERVAAEIARCGSLDNAVAALWNDSCGAPIGARVHDILKAALAEQSRRKASVARAA